MKKEPKDWHLQLAWFIAGIFATGALWYFASTGKPLLSGLSGLAAGLFALLAILLHRARDQANDATSRESLENDRLHGEVKLSVGEELVTFNELERTTEFDIVKVNTSHHFIGVASEHRWIEHRYPDARKLQQAITTLDRLKKEESDAPESDKIYFDVLDITFPDGRRKKIYFDISQFFQVGMYGTPIDPASKVASRLKDLYK